MITTKVNFRLFFSQCVLCHNPVNARQGICPDCVNDLPKHTSLCLYCGMPLSAYGLKQPNDHLSCHCSPHDLAPLTDIFCPWRYNFPLNNTISQGKYENKPWVFTALAQAAIPAFKTYLDQKPYPKALIAMPMLRPKEFERGFNQAALICDIIGAALNIPVIKPLQRTGKQKAQASLTRQARMNNLSEAFELTNTPCPSSVAIVDDVITTGASMLTAAAQLKQATPEVLITAWALARTPAPSSKED